MDVLLVEDEADYIARVQTASAQSAITLHTAEAFGLHARMDEVGTPLEDQLAHRLRDLLQKQPIDIVLLDTDLSRAKGNLRTQTEYREAFQRLGVPVCRYRKGQSQTALAKLDFLRRLAHDGASSIHVPPERREGDLAQSLMPWLIEVQKGFSALAARLQGDKSLLDASLGPAGILASLLDRPAIKADLLGYTSQNFYFFSVAETEEPSTVARYATQFGYWLHNYILAFPGPILNPMAAASFLNLARESFYTDAVQRLVASSRYTGPFGGLDTYYWKDDLSGLLDKLNGDIANAPELKEIKLARVDPAPYASAYYCVLTHEPIRQEDAAPNPDWIPAGASMTRIKESEYDELGPMLKS